MGKNKLTYWHGRNLSQKQIDTLKDNNFKNIDTDRLREISRKGGIASGEAKRKEIALEKLCRYQLHRLLVNEVITKEELADFEAWQKEKRRKERANSSPREKPLLT